MSHYILDKKINISSPNRVLKVWGVELWMHNSESYCMKELTLIAGFASSLHSHKFKRETFLVTSGMVEFEIEGNTVMLYPGDSIDVAPGQVHRFMAAHIKATVVEASTMHFEDDVFRVEPSRKL